MHLVWDIHRMMFDQSKLEYEKEARCVDKGFFFVNTYYNSVNINYMDYLRDLAVLFNWYFVNRCLMQL